jgi:hypothetical protein
VCALALGVDGEDRLLPRGHDRRIVTNADADAATTASTRESRDRLDERKLPNLLETRHGSGD